MYAFGQMVDQGQSAQFCAWQIVSYTVELFEEITKTVDESKDVDVVYAIFSMAQKAPLEGQIVWYPRRTS